MVVLMLDGSLFFLLRALAMLWHDQIGSDIVEVVHFLTFVVLNKAFVGTQLLLILGVKTVSNPIEHLWRDLVENVFTVGFAKIIHVVTATLS